MQRTDFFNIPNAISFWMKRFIPFLMFFLSILPLTFPAHSAVEEAIHEAKREAFLIFHSNIASERDFISWQQDIREQKQSPQKINPKSASVQDSADSSFTLDCVDTNIQQAENNIRMAIGQMESLETLRTPEHIIMWLTSFVKDQRLLVQEELEGLETQASFIPGMPRYNQRGAERANSLSSNYLSLLKLFMPFSSPDKIEDVFESTLKGCSPLYAGHFLHIKAYLLDLTSSTPPVHSWVYRYTSRQFEKTPSNIQERLRLKLNKPKLQQLLEGPLKPFGDQEKEIESLWGAYKEGKIHPGHWRKSEIKPEEKQLDSLQQQKKRHKKKVKKKGSNQGTQASSSSSLTPSTPLEEGEDSLNSRPQDSIPDLSQTLPSISQPEEDASVLENPVDKKVSLSLQPTLSPLPTAVDLSASSTGDTSLPSLSSNEDEEAEEVTYQYAPFVKLPFTPEEGLLAEPLPAAKIPSLKPKVHSLWKEFWTTLWMEWDDFRTLFVNGLDFGFEPLGGSIRKFHYPLAFGSRRFFIAHEPHGGRTTVGPATLRDLRAQLGADLGWTIGSFQSK